jgi:hypothetical protein
MAKDLKRKQLQLWRVKTLSVNEDIDLSSSVGECRNPTLREVWGRHSHSRKWDLESSGILENSELDCRGQNTLHWNVLYTVGKVLKCRCPKWPRMNHLDICRKKRQVSYDPKDKAILDPIFTEATAMNNPNRNPTNYPSHFVPDAPPSSLLDPKGSNYVQKRK